ncbi:DNA-binding response regulator [Aliarcobacter trophiarum LMG 25534]|uniref:DNA-binding response regulator n=1 Tax=Aliarcobacter trophiarum LMG 25534 TaxID=1032241 RepID=A0AAD0QK74_9BACT|nr:response regulator transcription factor [Aliarcobacter trophiarum]AXK49271.1 two-component system response regulator [Aliarcobacter trophiarum LMG 25534]RXI25308.1 DNA-binding response regulator [Aliarcobacter trophiarum]RXJ91450.1 DNA-binding response regulator [Aliarcobacter trophiarum LMG 25534]
MIKIAMIEDDLELAEVLIEYLKQFNIEVVNFEEPFLALSSLSLQKFDLIILDLTLPGMDGLDVCKELVKLDVPIIISSARSDITDKVTALKLGADDYLPKPYDPRELEVRITTILRRFNKSLDKTVEETKEKIFVLNEEKREILKNDKYLRLTAAEFEILSLFIKREGFVVSREDIFENSDVLNSDYENSGSLAVIINRIRHKIEDNQKEPKYLHTIRGMGYKFIQ